MFKHVVGCATQDQFADMAMSVGAHDETAGFKALCLREDSFANRQIAWLNALNVRR